MKKQNSLLRIALLSSVLLLLGVNRSFSQTLGAYSVNDSVAAAHAVPAVHAVLADEAHDQPAAEATTVPVVVPKLAASSNEKETSSGQSQSPQSPAKPKDEN